MTHFIAGWNAAAAVWGDRMWAVVWQSTLFIAAFALISALLLRRSAPNVRYWVWQIVALKLVVMPFWTYVIILTQIIPAMPEREPADDAGSRAVVSAAQVSSPTHEPTADDSMAIAASPPDPVQEELPAETRAQIHDSVQAAASHRGITWLGWLFSLWAFIVAAQLARIGWQQRRLARLLRTASPADAALSATVAEMAGRLGLRRAPQTMMTDVDCSPFVCGVRRPVLVLPRRLTTTLKAMELNQVLLHELAHVWRLDLVWGWIGEIARIAYFFHPAVHLISNHIRLERELACDQLAMATSGQEASEYAAMLVRVVSQTSEPAVLRLSAGSTGLHGKAP